MRLLQKGFAVVPRRDHRDRRARGGQDFDLKADRLDQRRFAHRLDNPGGSEDRDPPLDSEPRVIGSRREIFPLGNRDHRRKAAGKAEILHRTLELLPDHPARPLVDRRFADRERKALPRRAPDPFAAVDPNTRRFAPAHFRIDEHPVGHVRVVARVLLDRAGDETLPGLNVNEIKQKADPLRGAERIFRNPLPAQQHLRGRPGRARGAGAGCVAAPQALLSLFNIIIEFRRRGRPLSETQKRRPAFPAGRRDNAQSPSKKPESLRTARKFTHPSARGAP